MSHPGGESLTGLAAHNSQGQEMHTTQQQVRAMGRLMFSLPNAWSLASEELTAQQRL